MHDFKIVMFDFEIYFINGDMEILGKNLTKFNKEFQNDFSRSG